MHHRLTEVPELLGTSHSAYETAVEWFRALVRVKMVPTRLEEYLGILRQSPQGDADRPGVSVVPHARQLSKLNGCIIDGFTCLHVTVEIDITYLASFR